MKRILIAFCSLLCLSAAAQQNAKQWQIGINISPDITYRAIDKKNAVFTNLPHKHELNKPMAGYTLGANVLYAFNNRISVETGIHYLQRSFGSEIYKGTASELIVGHSSALYRTSIRYRYIELPLGATLKLGNKPLHMFVNISVCADYLLNGRNQIKLPDNKKHPDNHKTTEAYIQTNDFRRFNISVSSAVGVEYSIERFSFRAAPVFWYGLLKAQPRSVEGFNVRLWSAGLNVGCYYRLG